MAAAAGGDAAVGRRVRAAFTYAARYPADVSVRKGELCRVVAVVVPGQWWKVRREDAAAGDDGGNAPMAYFEMLADEPELADDPPPPAVPLATRPAPSPSADRSTAPVLPARGAPPRPEAARRSHSSGRAAEGGLSAALAAVTLRPAAARPSTASRSRSGQDAGLPNASRPAEAGEPVGGVDDNDDGQPEPAFTSVKDRLAALNGRGSGVGPPRPSSAASQAPPRPVSARQTPVPPPPSSTAAAAAAAAAASSGKPVLGQRAPPPPVPVRKPSALGVPSAETDALDWPSSAAAADAEASAAPRGAQPPKLPPRLPPRRPSASPSFEATPAPPAPARPAARIGPPAVPAGALRKPPPIPSTRPSPSPSPALAQPARPTASSAVNPPPPPRRQADLTPPTALPKPPPRLKTPPPLTYTLTVPHPQAQPLPDEALELGTQWFSRQPIELPQPLLALPSSSIAAGGSFTGAGSGVLNVGILFGDRSRTFVAIAWDGRGPARATQTHTAPPRPRTPAELADAAATHGERVARWCEAREGTVVGRGECWDLADHALKGVSADMAAEGEHAGLAEAVGIGFGEVVYVNVGGEVAWGPEGRIRRGDILQFVYATFKTSFSDGSSTTSTAGTPTIGHTAVVTADWSGRRADPVRVLQANVGGSKLIRQGEFSLGDLVSGEVRAFRPMDGAWGGGGARPLP